MWPCQQNQFSLSCPKTAGAQVCRPCPGSRPQSFCLGCAAASLSGSTVDQKLNEPGKTWVRDEDRHGRIITWQLVTSLTFFSHLNILLTGHIFSPGFLDGPSITIKLALPCLLKQKKLWGKTNSTASNKHKRSYAQMHSVEGAYWTYRMHKDGKIQHTKSVLCCHLFTDCFSVAEPRKDPFS